MAEPLVDVRVPGNVLIAGEYFITLEKGRGISIAVDRYVKAQIYNGTGQWRGTDGTKEFDFDTSLIQAILSVLEANGFNTLEPNRYDIYVDSSDLFSVSGRKLGLGSSAAVTLAVVTLLVIQQNGYFDPLALAAIAHEAHSLFQGRQGSGYDVYTSAQGGLCIFTGGKIPLIQEQVLPSLKGVLAYNGQDVVKTPGAVDAFNSWASDHKVELSALFQKNNMLIEKLAVSQSAQEFRSAMLPLKNLGLKLGDAINYSGQISIPPDLCDYGFKASGAGNELAIAPIFASDAIPHDLMLFGIDRGGVIWRA